MPSLVRILFLEDNPNDAELVRGAIESSSLQSAITWVGDKQTFSDAVEKGEFDIILSDYNLPQFDGVSALKIAKAKYPLVPFIFVSGTIGDDLAAETLKKGAADYILKDRLSKLPSAILRSLREVEMQSAQKSAEAQLRSVIRLIPGVIYQYKITPQGERFFPFMSEAIFELCGITRQQVYEDPGILFELIHEDDIGIFLKTIEESYQTLKPWNGDFRVRAGETEKWVRGHSIPQKLEDGSVLWNGILTDITQRKLADEKLHATQEYAENLIRTSNALVLVLDLEGKILVVNEAAELITGYSTKELTGKNWRLVVPENRYPQFWEEFRNLPAGKLPKHYENPILTKSGEERFIVWQNNELRENGKIAGSVSFGIDVTERKNVESQLLQAQKMQTLGTLAGGIAHDLNNQLTPINGFLDLMLSQLKSENAFFGYVNEALLAVNRCKEIIQRLMSFSRPSKQGKEIFLLQASFNELKIFFQKLLPSTINIFFESSEQLWPVLGNETELQTVFMNLAANSRDAMPQGGNLTIKMKNVSEDESSRISTLRPEPYVFISFADSGTGMSEKILSRIYEPFFTTKPVGHGTGLGLAMVFRIIQDHGGHITVASEVGRGTTFSIYLPAKPDAINETKLERRNEIKAISEGGEWILFADDEESIRNVGAMFLKRLGFEVIQAKDGEETLRLYKENRDRISLVMVDMTMPKLTGKQVLKGLLALNNDLKVILSSGYTSEGFAEDFIKEGAKAFIQKPYSLQVFSEAISEVLQRKPSNRPV